MSRSQPLHQPCRTFVLLFAVILVCVGMPRPASANNDSLIAFTVALRAQLFPPSLQLGGIFVMRPDGSGVRQLTQFETLGFIYQDHAVTLPDDHPAISPDGRKIAFSSNRDSRGILGDIFGGNQEIYVMNVNGTSIQRLTFSDSRDTEPVWSPDGTKIAFVSNRGGSLDIWVMNANGSDPQQLTSNPLPEIEPAWSPDGTKIAFSRILSGGVLEAEEKDVWVMDADGSNQRAVVTIDKEDHDAVFTKDSKSLFVTSERNDTPPFGDTFRVLLEDANGNPLTNAFRENLTADVRFGGGDPSLSPDGTQVAFFRSATRIMTNLQLWVVNTDGSNPHKVANLGLLNIHPNWGVLADTDNNGTPDYQEAVLEPQADLALTMTASPDPVVTNGILTYTLTVRNNGPDTAEGVSVSDFVPEGTTFVSVAATQGTFDAPPVGDVGEVRCALGTLAAGDTATVTLAVRADCELLTGDVIANEALVSGSVNDPNAVNNSVEATTTALDTPPFIANVTVDRPVLSPPDHKMVEVTVGYFVTDNCDPAPVCTLSVQSNEPTNGTGDGDTSPDWEVIDAHRVRLRVERSGTGNGRIYTITITCVDSHGNASQQAVTVSVPRNQK